MGLLVAGFGAAIVFVLSVRDMKKEHEDEKKRSAEEKEQIEKITKEEKEQVELRRKEEKEKMEAKIHELHLRLKDIEENRMRKIEQNLEQQGKLMERIDERTKNTDLSMSVLTKHLLDGLK